MPKKTNAPRNLGDAGLALWTKLTATYEFRIDELRILEDACREVDLIDRMELELTDPDGPNSKLVVRGSQGQPVANPLAQELRQHRSTLRQLIASLRIPDDEERSSSASRSEAARHAANARWGRGA